jgi:Family of unknown function (DUF6152)
MKGKLLAFCTLLAGVLMICGSAAAHHGSQGYDHTKRVTMKGTVSEFAWTNPHAQIYLDAKDASGNLVHWGLELNSPGNLVRLGWNHSSLKEGDQVEASFDPGVEGRHVGICIDIVKVDGSKLHSAQGCQGAPAALNN